MVIPEDGGGASAEGMTTLVAPRPRLHATSSSSATSPPSTTLPATTKSIVSLEYNAASSDRQQQYGGAFNRYPSPALPPGARTTTTSNNVLINGWPQTTHELLRRTMEHFGPVVSVNVVTSESRAFVLFGDALAARRCIEQLPNITLFTDVGALKLAAFPSEHGGAQPNRILYIRNIPGEVPVPILISVLAAIIGEVEAVRRYDCQHARHHSSSSWDEHNGQRSSLFFIEVLFREVPTHRAREALCDLPSLPRGDGSEVPLLVPLVVKYNETRQAPFFSSGPSQRQQGPYAAGRTPSSMHHQPKIPAAVHNTSREASTHTI